MIYVCSRSEWSAGIIELVTTDQTKAREWLDRNRSCGEVSMWIDDSEVGEVWLSQDGTLYGEWPAKPDASPDPGDRNPALRNLLRMG